jgi:GR25 family glycosyltransferase involved in LPS biosynthesis
MNTTINKVYIVHYAPLKDRRMRLEESLQKHGITNYEFITDYDRNTITHETIKQYYRGNAISLAPICITISHLEIYKKIIEGNNALTLILEDDAILAPDFKERLTTYCRDLPSDFEIGFLNDGCNMHAQGICPDQNWYPAKSSRTCCAYLITKGCCEKLVKSSIPFREVIDYEMLLV